MELIRSFQCSCLAVFHHIMTERCLLQPAFQRLDNLLFQYRAYWQIQPFYHRQYPWDSSLQQALDELSDQALLQLQQTPEQLANWLTPWIPQARALQQLVTELLDPPRTTRTEYQADDALLDKDDLARIRRFAQGIPGRKWQQMRQFTRHLTLSPRSVSESLDILEWCAGKGHLGRLIAYQSQQQSLSSPQPSTQKQSSVVTSLEWQKTLCDQGEAEALKWQLNQQFVHADAFAESSGRLLTANTHAVALHACGDLHCQLIQHSCQQQPRSVFIAPCCYHLIRADRYQPMSGPGQQSQIKLSKQDLKIPLQETVTGGKRVSQLRDTELQWRMAFDALLRDQLKCREYQPLPTIPKHLLTGAFEAFVHWAIHNRSLEQAVDNSDYCHKTEHYLEQGATRVRQIRRMELVQHLFRRPLELWLVLDRSIALEEAGFHVELTEFCDKQLTPRNILIKAHRPEGDHDPIGE